MKLLLRGDDIIVFQKRLDKLWDDIFRLPHREWYTLVPEGYKCAEMWAELVTKYFDDREKLHELYRIGLKLESALGHIGLKSVADGVDERIVDILYQLGGKPNVLRKA